MKWQSLNMKAAVRKAVLVAAGLSAVAFAGAPRAQAANPYDCQRRIEAAEYRLEEAIEHYGYYSRQANYERHELREVQASCEEESEQREWRDNRNNNNYGDRGYRNNDSDNRGYYRNHREDEDDD